MKAFDQIRTHNYGFRSGATTRFIKKHVDESQHRGSTTREELKRAFDSVEKGILLVDGRILKRIIRQHKDLRSMSFHVPHADEYLLPTKILLEIISNLDPHLYESWTGISTETSILLSEPPVDELESFSIKYFGLKFWSSLAHAETHRKCIQIIQEGKLDEARLKEAIAKIGIVEFEEIREVLSSENLVFNPKDNQEVFIEFLAYWVELSNFTPELVKKFFPSIKQTTKINNLLTELGMDQVEILTDSQPENTPKVTELLHARTLKENQIGVSLEFYEFRYHFQRVMEALAFSLKEKKTKEETAEYFNPIITSLINRCIQKDRIISSLNFEDLKREIIWSEQNYKFEDLELLNKVLNRNLSGLYKPAAAKELANLKKRGDDFIEENRENQKLKEITEFTVKSFGSIYEEYQNREITNSRTVAFHDTFSLILFFLYRWLLYLLSWIAPNSMWRLKIHNNKRIRQFKQSLIKAKLYAHYANPAKSLIFWRHALALIEKTQKQCRNIEPNSVAEKMREQIETQTQSFVDTFSNIHEVTEEQHSKTLKDLLEYLIERIEVKKEFGTESHLLFDLQFSHQKAIKQYRKLNFDGFFRSFGRNDLIEKLNFQQKLNKIKHLRAAKKRIQNLKVRDKDLKKFVALIDSIIVTTTLKFREELNQIIHDGFQQNGLEAKTSQEKVAFEKIKEELIDQIVAQGRFKFSYLRDIISRNDLKIPDLTSTKSGYFKGLFRFFILTVPIALLFSYLGTITFLKIPTKELPPLFNILFHNTHLTNIESQKAYLEPLNNGKFPQEFKKQITAKLEKLSAVEKLNLQVEDKDQKWLLTDPLNYRKYHVQIKPLASIKLTKKQIKGLNEGIVPEELKERFKQKIEVSRHLKLENATFSVAVEKENEKWLLSTEKEKSPYLIKFNKDNNFNIFDNRFGVSYDTSTQMMIILWFTLIFLLINKILNSKLLADSDPLLSLDRNFRKSLFGVYSGGEVYMRILQRLSSLLFGNLIGRFLTKFILLPFIGAFIVLEGLDHTVGILINLFVHHFHLLNDKSLIGLGLFLLAVINFQWGKVVAKQLWKGFATCVSFGFRNFIKLFYTRLFEFLLKFFLTPGLISSVLTFILLFAYRETQSDPQLYDSFFSETGTKNMMYASFFGGILFFNILFRTFIGMAFRDWLNNLVADTALRLTKTIWVGIFSFIMELFKSFLFYTEYVVYTVENSTRFYEKEKRMSIIFKGILGVFWFWFTYVIIIYINVLVEPQVNPIKHFPVVTVSHKMMLPFLVTLTKGLNNFLLSLYVPSVIAGSFAGLTIFLLPGLFGFLVWEFKENWKIYNSNRPKIVKPVLVGSHGETLPRLLRKGFHSGTIPKLLKKIRQTGLQAHKTGDWSKLRKFNHNLHHVEESLELFIERELFENMKRHPRFMESIESIQTKEIFLTNNKIEIQVLFEKKEGQKFELLLFFEDVFSWIIASCSFQKEEYDQFFSEQEKALLDVFLTIFFKKAGTELIREQIENTLLLKSKEVIKKVFPQIDDQMKVSYEIYDNKAILNIFHKEENKLYGKIEYDLFQKKIQPLLYRESEAPYSDSEPIPQEQLVFKELPLKWEEMNEILEKYEAGESIKFETMLISRIDQTRFEGIH